MTIGDLLRRATDENGTIHDLPVIFRDERGGWENIKASQIGSRIEISLDINRPFKDE